MKKSTVKEIATLTTKVAILSTTFISSILLGQKIGDHCDKKREEEIRDYKEECEVVDEEVDQKKINKINNKAIVKTFAGSFTSGLLLGSAGKKLSKLAEDFISSKF